MSAEPCGSLHGSVTRRKSGLRSIAALTIALLWPSTPLRAQEPPPPGPPTSSAAEEVQRAESNLTSIPGHLERSLEVIRRISGTNRSLQAVDQITRELPDLSQRLRELEKDANALPTQPRSPMEASLLRGAWANANSILARWQASVTGESTLLQHDLTTLETEFRLLKFERQRLNGNQVQTGLVSTIDRVMEQIGRAEEVARARHNALLAVQADLTELEIRTHIAQQSLRGISTVSPPLLLRLDSPPIWALWHQRNQGHSETGRVGSLPTSSSFFLLYSQS